MVSVEIKQSFVKAGFRDLNGDDLTIHDFNNNANYSLDCLISYAFGKASGKQPDRANVAAEIADNFACTMLETASKDSDYHIKPENAPRFYQGALAAYSSNQAAAREVLKNGLMPIMLEAMESIDQFLNKQFGAKDRGEKSWQQEVADANRAELAKLAKGRTS